MTRGGGSRFLAWGALKQGERRRKFGESEGGPPAPLQPPLQVLAVGNGALSPPLEGLIPHPSSLGPSRTQSLHLGSPFWPLKDRWPEGVVFGATLWPVEAAALRLPGSFLPVIPD